MEPQLLEFFQRQIEHQCNAALVNMSLVHQSTISDPINVEAVWAGVQGFLTATANISKALWGQSGRFSEQRQPLRVSLDVDDSNPLKPTAMRNNFDHFDERLDKWWETSTDHNSTDYAIASDASNFRGLDRSDIFRLLNPETGEVVFWGDRYSLVEMTDAIQQMLRNVQQELATPHWQKTSPARREGSNR